MVSFRIESNRERMVCKASRTDETASSCTSCACAIGNSAGRYAGHWAVSAPSMVRAGFVPSFWHFRRMQEAFLRPPGPFAIRVRAAMARSTAQHAQPFHVEVANRASRTADLPPYPPFSSGSFPIETRIDPNSIRVRTGPTWVRKGFERETRAIPSTSRFVGKDSWKTDGSERKP